MKSEFHLVNKATEVTVETFTTLKDCVDFIKKHVSTPIKFSIDEISGGDLIGITCASYVLENYELEELPYTVLDIY